MNALDRIASPRPLAVSAVVTAAVAAWLALTFFVTVGGAMVGA